MRKTAIIFDSTAIVNEKLIAKYDISFVSLNLAIDGENHASMSLNEEEFKKNFHTYKSIKSGSPSPYDFEEAINKKFDEGYKEVVVITLSSKISATYSVAQMAVDSLSPERQQHAFVHDSLYGSVGQDALIASLAHVLDQDPSAAELVTALEARVNQNTILFELDDLKHLVRGGRLSTIKYFISKALKIKPLIEYHDGELNVIAQNRNRTKTMDLILNKIDGFTKNFKNVYVNLFSYTPEDNVFKAIHDTIKTRWPHIVLGLTNRIDPVYMTHVGINGYAVSIISFN